MRYIRDEAATSGIMGASTGFGRTLRNLCGMAVLAASTMFLASCEGDRNEVPNPSTPGAEAITTETPEVNDIGVAVSALNDDPAAYVGRNVVVSGQIDDIHGPRVFTIGGDEWFGGELLVASAEPLPLVAGRVENQPLLKGDVVLVAGSLKKFVVAEVERELGFEVPADVEVEFKDKYVFMASALDLTPRIGDVAPVAGVATAPVTDLMVVATKPVKPELTDRPIQLSGIKVQSVVGDNTFWVGPSATQRVFVVMEEERTPGTAVEGKVNVNPGQTVTLSGTLKKVPGAAQAQQQWGLTAAEAAPLKNEALYVRTDKVQITSR